MIHNQLLYIHFSDKYSKIVCVSMRFNIHCSAQAPLLSNSSTYFDSWSFICISFDHFDYIELNKTKKMSIQCSCSLSTCIYPNQLHNFKAIQSKRMALTSITKDRKQKEKNPNDSLRRSRNRQQKLNSFLLFLSLSACLYLRFDLYYWLHMKWNEKRSENQICCVSFALRLIEIEVFFIFIALMSYLARELRHSNIHCWLAPRHFYYANACVADCVNWLFVYKIINAMQWMINGSSKTNE